MRKVRYVAARPPRALWLLLAGIIVAALAPPLRAADAAPLTAAKVKQRALDAIKSGAVQFKAPNNRIEGRTMMVNLAPIPDEQDADTQNPLVKLFYDQVEIELLRTQLLKRQSSRRVMEPYYAKMEELIAKKLAVAQDGKLEQQARDDQLEKLDETYQKTLSDGLQAVAVSIGMENFQFLNGAAQDAHDVKLVAPTGATIDVVRQTTAGILHDAGKTDKDFPWTSYQAGDTATMSGAYYCRIRLGGKEATFNKRVGAKTDQLDFPNP